MNQLDEVKKNKCLYDNGSPKFKRHAILIVIQNKQMKAKFTRLVFLGVVEK